MDLTVNRTYITKDHLAVGHVDGATTYKYYVMDARSMDPELFVIEDKAG